MSEDGDEIEFLDEDADIVQQCVLLQPKLEVENEEPPAYMIPKTEPRSPLLVERSAVRSAAARRKRKKSDDSDYDPTEDLSRLARKRRPPPPSRRKPEVKSQPQPAARKAVSALVTAVHNPPQRALPVDKLDRRSLTIRIPDFDDPLCLPVRGVARDEGDARRLQHWNRLCLQQMQRDEPLRPRSGEALCSKRTVVLRNLFNKSTGKTETSFWSKITVMGQSGESKSEQVQSVLPRYREKKMLGGYRLGPSKPRQFSSRSEVILGKEKDGQEETLVAYKPDEALAMVFKMSEVKSEHGGVVERKRCLEERAACRACARCYQASWRGVDTTNTSGALRCPACARACVSIHSLLSHLKTHAPGLVRPHRRAVSSAIAKVLAYHYRCRVCQRRFPTTRDLRRHVSSHKGLGQFFCEIGSHAVS